MLPRLLACFRRAIGVLPSSRRDADLADELASHLQLHIDDNLRAGMSPEEARRQALLKLGGVVQTREAYRDRRGLPWVEALAQDLRYGIRFLSRSPGFTAVAVLSLALGIGANTAIFSLVDSLLLRALPVSQPDELVQLRSNVGPRGGRSWWTNPIWEQIRDRPDLFAAAGAFARERFNVAPSGEIQPVEGLLVSGRFFDVFGVQPLLGRTFIPADDRRGGGADGPVAVISDAFWQSHFHGAGDILGQLLTVNGVPFTVIGVLPRAFFGPWVGDRFDVYVPLGAEPLLDGRDQLALRGSFWLTIMARLKPGQSPGSASAALQASAPAILQATAPLNWRPQDLAGYLHEVLEWRPAPGGAASPMREEYQSPLLAVLVVVGLVLLMACVNLANLLMARADARRHEMGIRRALGASRARLVRQSLIESVLLSLGGGALGLLVATWGSRAIMAPLTTFGVQVYLDLTLNWHLLAFATGVAIVVALLFGTMPALRATGVSAVDVVPARAGRVRNLPGRRSLSSGLVAAQVACCLVLLVGAGLFLETFVSLERLQPGFDESPVLVVDVRGAHMNGGLTMVARQELLQRVRSEAGVGTAAWSLTAPLDQLTLLAMIENPPGLSLPDSERRTPVNVIGPGWLEAMGTPLLAGREFSHHDAAGAQPVAIVNEAFAKRFFPGVSPLGRSFQEVQVPGAHHPLMTIVGVAGDAVYGSLRHDDQPTFYMPLAQLGPRVPPSLTLCVRAAHGSAASIVRDTAAAMAAAAPGAEFTLHSMDDLVAESLSSERLLAMLSAFFGMLALLLAAIGLYGVVSYTASRRRTEIGIRMALGARPAGIVRMMLGRIGLTMGVGLAIGGVLSVWLARFVKSLLYGLQPNDPATLVGAIAVLAAVGVLAAWLPARRAARIDPMEALREN